MESLLSQDGMALVTIAVCLMMSAFSSAAETAITTMGVLKSRHLLEQITGFRKHLELWVKHPSRVLTTLLIFNNMVTILASAVATDLASRYMKDSAIGVATVLTTLLVLIFGEITPKSYARAHAETLAPLSLKVVFVLYQVFYPIIWALSEFTNFLVRKMGAGNSIRPPITEDELEFLIEEGEKAGVLEDTKKEMITGVFEFDETKVREIMTPRTDIVAVDKKQDIQTALELINDSGHSRIPVYDERIDNIVGILFAKDLLRLAMNNPNARNKTNISDIMREPIFVPDSKPLMEVFKDLKRTKTHIAVIIDEYGGTAGIVTMEDILEEIVGDIQDEYDVEEAEITEIDRNAYEVAGSVNISDFIEYFGLDKTFEEEVEGEVDTIGGWMTQLLGDLPEVGQTLIHEPLTIEVKEVDRHRIVKLRVVKMLSPEVIPEPAH